MLRLFEEQNVVVVKAKLSFIGDQTQSVETRQKGGELET